MKLRPNFVVLGLTVSAMALGLIVEAPSGKAQAQPAAQTAPAPLSEEAVKALQESLNKQGASLKIDGKFEDATRAAIKAFQGQHHLPVTGEADAATLAKLGVGAPAGGMPGGAQIGSGPVGRGAMGPQMMGQGMPMPGMMGPQTMGQGMPMQGMMGPQMMGPGRSGMMGPDKMDRPDMSECDMPGRMAGLSRMARGDGPGRDMVVVPVHHLSVDEVRHYFEHRLAAAGNKRISVGEVKEVDDERIVADIVTKDSALVDRYEVDRHTGRTIRVD